MLYDIPPRSSVPIEVETLVRLAEHPRIVAVKDAKGDFGAGSWTMARTDLAFYCGDDMLNLPWLSVGAVGVVSVAGHVVTPEIREMVLAHVGGDTARATAIHQKLLPVYTGMFRIPGLISAKAAMNMLGLPGGPVRLPLVDATSEEQARLKDDLARSGVKI
jgi:4-hydroxy-tetrahydrodipicolinate synthase